MDSATTTALLARYREGDQSAFQDLYALLYPQLKKVAHNVMRPEKPSQTLNTTALVNEAFLKLSKNAPAAASDVAHFRAIAAFVMRQILIEAARKRQRVKRGGGWYQVEFDEAIRLPKSQKAVALLDLDRALTQLEKESPVLGKLVLLKFYGGLTNTEAAEVMGCSIDAFNRKWKLAKAVLHERLTEVKK